MNERAVTEGAVGERLQKLIARAGVTSRRKAEQLIEEGRVTVNGEVVRELGATADLANDRVEVDGRRLRPERQRHLALHKPPGVLCALSDAFGRTLVVDLLGGCVAERVYPAGRLDLESEGLVLMTNDGDLMEAVTRPGRGVEKVYRVTVEGRPPGDELRRLEAGIELDGRRTLPCRISRVRVAAAGRDAGAGRQASELEVVLHEGKKNQIRRMFATIGFPVVRLVRLAIGPVRLGELEPGEWRDLGEVELAALRRAAGLESGAGAGGRRRARRARRPG